MNGSSARIGYARVSTADQNLDAQTAALQAAGCTMVRTETGGGATLAGRPELGTILEFIHPGETLVVTRIDRLARWHRSKCGNSSLHTRAGLSRGTQCSGSGGVQ